MENNIEKKGFVEKYAKILVPFAVLCGACSGAFSAMISAPALVIGFVRLTVALPFFWVPIVFKKSEREKIAKLDRKDLLLCLASGMFLFLHFFCWFSSVKWTNVSSAAVFASFHPLVVLFITVFILKRKVSWKSIVAIVCAILGGAIIMCADITALSGGHMKGNIFAFGAAMFMGIYFAIGDKARKNVPGNIYVLLVFFSCWIFFILGLVATGTTPFGYTGTDYLFMVIQAFVCQIGAHAVFNMCIGRVSSLYVSTWEAGDPVFSTLLAVIIVQQIPSGFEVLGCIIVVVALYMYSRFERD